MTGMVQMEIMHGAACGAIPGILLPEAKTFARPLNQGKSSLLKPAKAKKFHGRERTQMDVYALNPLYPPFSPVQVFLRDLTRINAILHLAPSHEANHFEPFLHTGDATRFDAN